MPSTQRNGDGKETEARLDTQKVLDLAVGIASQLDVALSTPWGRRVEWEPYLTAVEALALGLDRRGNGSTHIVRSYCHLCERKHSFLNYSHTY